MRKELLMSRLLRLETAALPLPSWLPVVVVLPDEDAPQYASVLAGIAKRQAAGQRVIVIGCDEDPLEALVAEMEAI